MRGSRIISRSKIAILLILRHAGPGIDTSIVRGYNPGITAAGIHDNIERLSTDCDGREEDLSGFYCCEWR
jgi:hypothetical protein